MLGFFKKKISEPIITNPDILAVVDGTIIEMEKVKDPVFAQKTIGDGFAIDTTGTTFYAPHDATVTMLFPTNHAFGLTFDDGMELLVHIGIDTVNENGKGFKCLTKVNTKVKAGDPLVMIDQEYLKSRGYDLTAILIFTNAETYSSFSCEYGKEVHGGKDIAATYVK